MLSWVMSRADVMLVHSHTEGLTRLLVQLLRGSGNDEIDPLS